MACFGAQKLFIVLFSISLISLLIYITLKNYSKLGNILKFSIAMILGGGFGNLIDRLFRGYVIDYIDVNRFFTYPLFNFADVCIVVGCILIVMYLVIEIIKKQEKE